MPATRLRGVGLPHGFSAPITVVQLPYRLTFEADTTGEQSNDGSWWKADRPLARRRGEKQTLFG